ncbi:MAG TPA: hypothetical protein VGC54_11435 [Planctomycetota bacterium]
MRIALATVAVLFAAASPVAAQDDPPVIRRSVKPKVVLEAEAWLDRMSQHIGRPVEIDQTMRGAYAGQSMEGVGEFVYADPNHFYAYQTLSSLFEGQTDPRKQSMTMVGDGETLWLEGRDSFLKIPLVNHTTIANMRRLASLGDFGFGGGEIHPFAQVRDIANMVEFTKVEVADGKVTIHGKLREDAKYKLGERFMGFEFKRLIVMLNEKTVVPISVRVEGDESLFIHYRYTNVRMPERSELDMNRFVYMVPEDARVNEIK